MRMGGFACFRQIIIVFFLTMATLLGAYGQANVSYNDIEKIIIIEKSGGMGGSCSSVNEVIKQGEKWAIFNTEEIRAFDILLSQKHPNFSRTGMHVLQGVLDAQAVRNLITVLWQPLVHFTPAVLGITPGYLQTNAGKLSRMYNGLNAAQKAFFLKVITQPHVDGAIRRHFSSYGTDVFTECTIKIVKKNHDTVFMTASYQHAFMLPWVINKRDTTYNKAISRFAVAALRQDTVCNLKALLQGGDIYNDIYDDLYRRYCEDLFTRQNNEARYAQAFALLKSVYNIVSIRDGGDFAFLTMQPKTLPANIFIDDALHLGNRDSVMHAINLKNAIAAILKRPNFIFKYAANPLHGTLTFEAPGDSVSLFRNQQGDFPYLGQFSDSQVITFRYRSKTNPNEYSAWYLLPNGLVVLSFYEGSSVFGISKETLGNYAYRGTFNLFDEKGKPVKINSAGGIN